MFALLAGHAGIGYYLLAHARIVLGLSTAVMVFAVITHLGVVGGLLSRLSRGPRRRAPQDDRSGDI